MFIEHYGRLPIFPRRTLRRHQVFETGDSRFRAAARVQQALWRQQNGWKAGYQKSPDGKRRKIGNCLGAAAANLGANFISDEIAKLVRFELVFREDGALMDEARLSANLLSSMPVVFNVFGAMKLDLKLATRVFRRLFPDFVRTVTGILFEHAPDRGNPAFTADFTAFDLLVKCRTVDGKAGFLAIEVKFSETLTEKTARLRARYDELSANCGCFKNPDDPALRVAPIQQFWRQHLLAASMLENHLFDAGRFIVVAPRFNSQAQSAIKAFQRQVADQAPVMFGAVTLETVIEKIKKAGAQDIAARLFDRYCDFSSLRALI